MSIKEYGKETVTGAGMAVQVVIWSAILMFGFALLGYGIYAFFGPKNEQVRYNIFKESQTYNDGMLRDLQNLQMEYMKANDEQKAALKAITLHRFSIYPEEKLPADLRVFYYNLKTQ